MGRRKRSNTTRRGQSGWGDALYSTARVSSQDRARFDAWLQEAPVDAAELLEILGKDSYRVTTKRDYNSSCWQVTLTQQDEKHRNAGIICISRSDDIWEALALSAYKVFAMYPDTSLPTAEEEESWG